MSLISVVMYNSHIVHVICSCILKHSCITKVSLERDLHWKVQHLQHDFCLEVKNLIMFCIRGVCLLFSFVILHLNIIDVKPDVVLGQTC